LLRRQMSDLVRLSEQTQQETMVGRSVETRHPRGQSTVRRARSGSTSSRSLYSNL
jgi:hypothetical protein